MVIATIAWANVCGSTIGWHIHCVVGVVDSWVN